MTRLPIAAAAFVVLFTLITFSVTSAVSKTPPGQQGSPSNTSAPSISGTAAIGSTLQASSGSWSGHGISYSFQWQRCSSTSSCAAITSATGSSYLVGSGDAGDSLRVSVTATNKSGSATATSAPTAVVPSPPGSPPPGYTNTALPTVSGTTQVGQTLTATNGSWSPTPSNWGYAWQLCDSGGKNCQRSATSANQKTYTVQSSDVGHTIRVQVAANNDFTYSIDSNPTVAVTGTTGSPPPPPSPNGTVYFDGRAKLMTQLYRVNTTDGGESPNIWTCTCFQNNDLSLSSDGTFGQAYKSTVPIGDHNPWDTTLPTFDGAGQLSIRRNNDLGQWDYYAMAVKIPSWAGAPANLRFVTLASLGYQTSSSDQVALGLQDNGSGGLNFNIQQNSGYANNPSGWAAGSVSYKAPFLPVTYGQWQEFVIGVKWATDNTGAVQVYSRAPGGSWSKVFERLNEPTYLYGVTGYGTFAQDGSNWPTVIDKIGLYYGEYDITPTETVYESGLTRSSDLATAESTLP
jgi:Polysaccharide lyase